MYVVYICAYIVLVCIGIYIHAYESFYAVATFCRGALLFLATFATFATFATVFSSLQPFRSLLPRHALAFALLPFCLSCVPSLRSLRTFCRSFVLKRLQRSFQTVFQAVLSGLIVWRVYLYRLHRLARLNSLICGKIAVLGVGRGDYPLRQAARGATEVAQNFEISEKIFSKNSSGLFPHAF